MRIRNLFDPGSGIQDGKTRIRDPEKTYRILNAGIISMCAHSFKTWLVIVVKFKRDGVTRWIRVLLAARLSIFPLEKNIFILIPVNANPTLLRHVIRMYLV